MHTNMITKLLLPLIALSSIGEISAQDAAHELLRKAYPDSIVAADTSKVAFKNGKQYVIVGSSKDEKALLAILADPRSDPKAFCISDMFVMKYPEPKTPIPTESSPPPPGFDPGRVRSTAFFDTMYGSTKEEVERHLVSLPWVTTFKLEGEVVSKIRITKINGVDKKLAIVRNLLLALPPVRKKELRGIVFDVKGYSGYRQKKIRGASFPSAHSWGIAVDINWDTSYYHRDSKKKYANNVPQDVVNIFESQGFIWGGRWSHFDSMHFEYRPELILRNTPPNPRAEQDGGGQPATRTESK